MNRKIIKSIFCLLPVLAIVGCNDSYPLKDEQYKHFVYLTRAIDEIKYEYVDYAYEQDTIYVSVSVSGTHFSDRDITVTFKEDNEAIEAYNKRNFSAGDIQYQHLPSDAYSYPQNDVVIRKGEPTALYPVYVNPESLHCDSLYIIPISLESVSNYEMRTNIDTVLLARINLVNKYSDRHYMHATRNQLDAENLVAYQAFRNPVAINKNTIRVIHEEVENLDNLVGHALTITVNDDNTLSFATWEEFPLTGGGGIYRPEWEMFDLWYEYTTWEGTFRVEGFLYKVPETELEQEDIDDWIKDELEKREEE